jgi:hypothetical protein
MRRGHTVVVTDFMRHLAAIVATLAVITAGCASHPAAGSSIDGVPVVASSAKQPMVPALAFKQLAAKDRKALNQARNKIHSLDEGLQVARAASALPILAAADEDGWFFYATATFTDATTHQPVGFISGLAIRHGTRDIFTWSIW